MPKRRHSTPSEAYEDGKRRKSSENEEEEMEDETPIDNLQGKEAEVGIVERVILKNFMCHGLLDVKLGPHVNFIIGRNGSGKSAVVTGLVVGLGGLASTTNRGNKVRSFVKTGKQTAEVTIWLRNRGPDAYKPELYGNSIIVQRKISADVGTKYALKSAQGKLVSDKLEELRKIKDFFNIQVENPVAVLNQDTSRNFLHSKSPFDKYKFFLKATQLEQMKEQYDEANASKEKSVHSILYYEKMLPSLKETVQQWEEKFRNLGTISDLKEKVQKLKYEMAWAFVAEKEKELEPLQKDLKMEEARLPKFVQKANESKVRMEQSQEKLKAVQAQLLTITQEAEQLKPRLKEKRDILTAAKTALRSSQSDCRNIERDLRNATYEREQIQGRIRELQQAVQHDYEAERGKRQEKIKSLEDQLLAVQSRQRVAQHEREQFQAATSKASNEIYNITRDERAKQLEKNNCQRDLQTLMSSRSNRIQRFGVWVPSALAKIEEWCRQGKFHKKPRGPLGACFQLKDQSWAPAVEGCLRALIHTFVCHDFHDEKLLEQIFQQELGNKRRPAIITCPFKDSVHDVSGFRVRNTHYPAVLDMIECEDPVVLNTLIDQRGIENIILIAESAEARNVMMHRPPINCKEAFTRESDHLYCKPTFRYYSSDNTSARFLMSDVEEEINLQKANLQVLTQELKALGQQRQTLQKQMAINQKEEQRQETQLMKLRETLSNLNYELNELRSVEDPIPVDITTLEEDVQNYSQQISSLTERQAGVRSMLQEKEAECQRAEKEFKAVEVELLARANSDIPIKDELNSAQMALDEAQQHLKHYQASLKEQEVSIANQRKKIQAKQKEIEEDIGKASQICAERIDTRRTPRDIERQVNQFNIRIRQEEKTQGDPQEISQKYRETKERYQIIQKDVKSFKRFLQKLDAALKIRSRAYLVFQQMLGHRLKKCFYSCLGTRKFNGSIKIDHNTCKLDIASLEKVMNRRNEAYAEFKRMIAVRTKYFFIVMLSHRQYIGRMTFDHKVQSLEMWVAPSEDSEINKDLKSLSGGERSFSTVCFILSLWNAMESPFRCLDEFDVYMDLVNRRISMDMMLEMTRSQTTKQFIFLTPQDMSHLSTSVVGKPRIFQMPAPCKSKGQTTLHFNEGDMAEEEEEDN